MNGEFKNKLLNGDILRTWIQQDAEINPNGIVIQDYSVPTNYLAAMYPEIVDYGPNGAESKNSIKYAVDMLNQFTLIPDHEEIESIDKKLFITMHVYFELTKTFSTPPLIARKIALISLQNDAVKSVQSLASQRKLGYDVFHASIRAYCVAYALKDIATAEEFTQLQEPFKDFITLCHKG